ncbi:hypothetical protein FQN57_007122 [Myotisia sp. PD_48]|nr:hypothetical protein FQN57_007122 [Myotisia sp. PD_48]
MVVSINIKYQSENISISIWIPGVAHPQNTNPRPQKVQEVIMKHKGPEDCPTITGGPITIPFRSVFDREPITPEADFIFDNQDLLDIAERTWIRIQVRKGVDRC